MSTQGRTREEARRHKRNLQQPTDILVQVTIREKTLRVRNSHKGLELWVPREGHEAQETIEWIIVEIKRDVDHSGQQPQEDPQEERVGGDPPTCAEAPQEADYRGRILKVLEDHPRCETIRWRPARSCFALVIVGEMNTKEIYVKELNKQRKLIMD